MNTSVEKKEGKAMAKDRDYRRMIHTVRWLKMRKYKLTQNPLCERCETMGIATAASEVHHVIPVETALGTADKEKLMFDIHNLQSLCHNCHVQVHTELGRGGKILAQKRAKHQREEFIKKFL